MEISCVMAKPDAVGKKVVGKIIERLESAGFTLTAARLVRPTEELMAKFYAEHQGKAFYPGLLRFITSGPLLVMAWRGENAIAKIREMIGATNPAAAAPGTLRAEYGTDNRRNLVHASDAPASGERETKFWFTPEDLAPYDPQRWSQSQFAPPAATENRPSLT